MPRDSCADKADYDKTAAHLTELFENNIKNFDVPEQRSASGRPKAGQKK